MKFFSATEKTTRIQVRAYIERKPYSYFIRSEGMVESVEGHSANRGEEYRQWIAGTGAMLPK